jgi:hypothetical protein
MLNRYFSLVEARAVLPLVKEWSGKAMLITRELRLYSDSVQKLAADSSHDTGSPEGTVYLNYLLALQECVSRIQETGCLLKSVEDGLVDFPHLKEGREVYLCWKYGEDDIGYWHETDAGFRGRTPIDVDKELEN